MEIQVTKTFNRQFQYLNLKHHLLVLLQNQIVLRNQKLLKFRLKGNEKQNLKGLAVIVPGEMMESFTTMLGQKDGKNGIVQIQIKQLVIQNSGEI